MFDQAKDYAIGICCFSSTKTDRIDGVMVSMLVR